MRNKIIEEKDASRTANLIVALSLDFANTEDISKLACALGEKVLSYANDQYDAMLYKVAQDYRSNQVFAQLDKEVMALCGLDLIKADFDSFVLRHMQAEQQENMHAYPLKATPAN